MLNYLTMKTQIVFCITLALAAMTCFPAHAAKKPNVIIILADDLGYSDIGCYGSEIATPHLDGLAANGLRFSQFYNTSRCCPTRASILTGLYPHQVNMGFMVDSGNKAREIGNDAYAGDLNKTTPTIAEILRPAGYRTYASGKWHVVKKPITEQDTSNWPLQRGFDRYYGILDGSCNLFKPPVTRDNTRFANPSEDKDYPSDNYYFTDAIGDHATAFLKDHAAAHADKPFFLYLTFTAPHWPMHAPEQWIQKYKGRYDGGYTPIHQARLKRLKDMKLIPGDCRPETMSNWENVKRKDWEARCMEVYAAMVECMDANIGKVLTQLRAMGELDNTLIVFLSDNGACAESLGRTPDAPMPGPVNTYISYGANWAKVSNTPYRLFKERSHEGGIRTPFIAHWPNGITRKGEIERQQGHIIDLMATAVDLAQVKPTFPKPLEGTSLVPAFKGEPLKRTNALFFSHNRAAALRDGDWKLVTEAANNKNRWELYDMSKDQTEMDNLASKHPERAERLRKQWEDLAKRHGAVPWIFSPPYAE